MVPEFFSFGFLSQPVPLWFALLMGFTAPHLWSGYIKDAATIVLSRYI